FDGLDDYIVDRAILWTGWDIIQFVNNLLGVGVGNFTEDSVAVLQPRGCNRGDKELGPVGTRTSICHGQFIWFVEVQFWVEFIFELVARSTDATAQWVSALDHEV